MVTGPIPVVLTSNYNNVLLSTVDFKGIVTDDGGFFVKKRGFCWSSTYQNPTIHNDTMVSFGDGAGAFSSTIKGLKGQTKYYIRSYATNNNGTGYGSIFSVKTIDTTITDIDSNHYRIVQIGIQIWMAENLKVTHYLDGEDIPDVTDATKWTNLTTGALCWYNNEPLSYGTIYGALYNWYAVSDSRNLSPAGWHVPTDTEWTTLIKYLGEEGVAGGKMKEKGTAYWLSPNTGADNSSGFSALPGGACSYNGTFDGVGSFGYWWTATENSTLNAWTFKLYSTSAGTTRGQYYKSTGLSVRCVRNS